MLTKNLRMLLVVFLAGAIVVPAVASASQESSAEMLRKFFTPPGNTTLFASEDFSSLLHGFENITGNDTIKTEPMGQQTGGSNGLMNSSWPMYCHDLHHTGRSLYNTVDNPYVVKWRFSVPIQWLGDSPTIASDGTIYFGTDTLFALNSNGTMKWNYYMGETIIGSTPAIDENGTIYLGTWGSSLWAINPDGTLKWKISHLGGSIGTSPAISPNGTIYVGDVNGQLSAISYNGQVQWHYITGGAIESAPAISNDGTIYVGSHDYYFYAINPNGTLRWRYHTGNIIASDPSIAPDGTIYITSGDGYLYAFNPNGTLRWQTPVGWGSLSVSAIASDGTIYVAGAALYAIYPNGTLRWTFNLGIDRWVSRCSAAISADGTIYVGACIGDGQGGDLIAVNPNGTERWRGRISNDAILNSLAIGSDGTVYSTAEMQATGDLVAIGRGPLIVHADGPYHGYCDHALQFSGTLWGGSPPYTYHWDFGDGTTSDQQNPTHNYTAFGNYTATLTGMDSEGNTSSDTAQVSITYATPTVTISSPTKGLYLFGARILPLPGSCVIIGPITIEVNASEIPIGIAQVQFLINGKLKNTDTEAPYSWTWMISPRIKEQEIFVRAIDNAGGSNWTRIYVHKLL